MLLLLHPSRLHFIQTNVSSTPASYYTNLFSQLDWPGFYLHKLFWQLLCTRCYLDKLLLDSPAPRIVSTQTFARNSCTPDSIYTDIFSQLHRSRFLVHKLRLATLLHLVSVQQPRTSEFFSKTREYFSDFTKLYCRFTSSCNCTTLQS